MIYDNPSLGVRAFSADTFNLDQRQTDPKSGSWRPRRCRNHLKFAFFKISKLHLSLQDRDLEGWDVSLHYAERIQMEMGGVAVMEKGNLQLQQRRHIIIIIIVAVMEMGKRHHSLLCRFSPHVADDYCLWKRQNTNNFGGFCTKMSFSPIYFSFCAFWRQPSYQGLLILSRTLLIPNNCMKSYTFQYFDQTYAYI